MLRKYNSTTEIFQEFFEVRRQKYVERREYELKAMDAKLKFTDNQVKLDNPNILKTFDENVEDGTISSFFEKWPSDALMAVIAISEGFITNALNQKSEDRSKVYFTTAISPVLTTTTKAQVLWE